MEEKKKIKVLMFGSDPEFLLRDKDTKELVSSIGIIPGTKEEPQTVEELGDGYTIQIDNVLGEISVAPATNSEGLWNNIQKALTYVSGNILPNNVEIYHASSGTYTDEQLDNEIAKLFGCSPSVNAWSEQDNEAPEAGDINFRGCGAHIHLSYENPDPATNCLIGRVFDLFCTLPSIILDEDTKRRHFYGQAGEIRHCKYGVELRTLGGFILSDKNIYNYMMDNLLKAIEFINSGKEMPEDIQIGVQIAINTQDKGIAKAIMAEMEIPMYNLIKA